MNMVGENVWDSTITVQTVVSYNLSRFSSGSGFEGEYEFEFRCGVATPTCSVLNPRVRSAPLLPRVASAKK